MGPRGPRCSGEASADWRSFPTDTPRGRAPSGHSREPWRALAGGAGGARYAAAAARFEPARPPLRLASRRLGAGGRGSPRPARRAAPPLPASGRPRGAPPRRVRVPSPPPPPARGWPRAPPPPDPRLSNRHRARDDPRRAPRLGPGRPLDPGGPVAEVRRRSSSSTATSPSSSSPLRPVTAPPGSRWAPGPVDLGAMAWASSARCCARPANA